MACLNRPGDQIPLAEEPASRRNPDNGEGTNHKSPCGERHFTTQTFQILKGISLHLVNDVSHDQKHTECHESVIHDMQNRTGHRCAVSEPGTANHVAHFCNDDIGKHLL